MTDELVVELEQVWRTIDVPAKVSRNQPSPHTKSALPGNASATLPNETSPAHLLRQIGLKLHRGQCLNVIGPSGSGKSTLLRLINRLDDASRGRITVLGKPVEQWPIRELRRAVSMVFQEPTLLDQTPRQNMYLPFTLCGQPADQMDQRIAEACRLAGFDPALLDRAPGELSVGQRQRATLARALIAQPQILLLDEPTSGLDAPTANDLLDRLDKLRREKGLTLLIVTHRLHEVRRLGGQVAVMIDGMLLAHGPVDEVLIHPPAGPVARFIEEAGSGSR